MSAAPEPVTVKRGSQPLILAMPHSGTFVPEDIFQTLNSRGQLLADTDWHIPRVYEGLADDVTVIQANFHRYVIDANRPPGGESLYPGQNTTGLCPRVDFEGKSIYDSGAEPDDINIELRRQRFHAPYHAAIQYEIDRLKDIHGFAILYDCHSIRSEIDFLFEGRLPDLNIGTFDGKSCATVLEDSVLKACQDQSRYSYVLNGRFKGGWTTRHYGQPDQNVHAIQMELCQSTYMNEFAPWNYQNECAKSIRPVLKQVLENLLNVAEV